ncbi:transglutaminase family protein [Oceanibium sediminis]|uniref:transglutaminase family protein n=1 Tax=Oceanibium sediminis TaxID=2026339 RepID=UPI000DD356A7|nr:transglutaminase family protein [Oceanibium sediminis]
MQITVEHTSTYRFESPRMRVVQSHKLTPASNGGQSVSDWDVSVDGASFGAGFRDGAGDNVCLMTLPGPVSEIAIRVKGSVTTEDTSGILMKHKEVVAPRVYLRSTWTTAPGIGLRALAQRVSSRKAGTLEGAHDLMGIVAEEIAYVPGSTHADMTAAEVEEQGRGVCQDQTHVLITLARILGMPARYVTGYLFADAEGNSHEASHAWAEIHVADLGWVGFDATNQCCPDDRYIRVCSGMDAQDAAPIRGISLGSGDESLDISVSVAAQQ